MNFSRQQIRFCTSRDNVRIAYAICGKGPPLVRAVQWATHLELDWQSPVWQPWLDTLARSNTLVRYDARGCGLSDRDVDDFSSERHVDDLEAVTDACGLKQFALLGVTGGGPSAVMYATRHPERVTHLLLYGSFLRGRIVRSTTPELKEETEMLLRMIAMGWERDDPSFRQLYTSQLIPGATAEQFRSFNESMRQSATPATAEKILRVLHGDDVSALAPQIRCPTLVLHARGDARVPFEQGRELAAAIPNARLVPLDSGNHFLLESEPAWKVMVAEIEAFLPQAEDSLATREQPTIDGLTPRENQVLELVARGLGNRIIAERLQLGEKTVRNNVSNIMSKLAVHSRAEAIVRAREQGFGHPAKT